MELHPLRERDIERDSLPNSRSRNEQSSYILPRTQFSINDNHFILQGRSARPEIYTPSSFNTFLAGTNAGTNGAGPSSLNSLNEDSLKLIKDRLYTDLKDFCHLKYYKNYAGRVKWIRIYTDRYSEDNSTLDRVVDHLQEKFPGLRANFSALVDSKSDNFVDINPSNAYSRNLGSEIVKEIKNTYEHGQVVSPIEPRHFGFQQGHFGYQQRNMNFLVPTEDESGRPLRTNVEFALAQQSRLHPFALATDFNGGTYTTANFYPDSHTFHNRIHRIRRIQ